MSRNVELFRFHFHNGGHWEVPVKFIGDVWIKRISASLGRIHDGNIVEIRPAQALKIEILPEADTFQSLDINQGGLETGMFETVVREDDVERVSIEWDNGEQEEVFFPFLPSDESRTDNKYMTAKIGENGRLYIVIDKENTVDDIYPNK